MLRNFAFAAIAALTTATGALAEDSVTQTVVITDFGYFPMVTYLDEGDTVIFSNQTDSAQNVMAVRELETDVPQWETGSLAPLETYSLIINTDTVLQFETSFGNEVNGEFSFDEPVLN
ncbi:hypothetical protein BVC71_10260 [Marivivens niveibacter]|uniref:Uncharacterized protein n=1 Tax=Marivivens niveibacter TaxID=1930667 RepID=A0A251WXL6_9RHOB|nr:hypothetical protein [Marivivens niveibacter]OUD09086.1 hypothetical protein BVC71_10260 [Marivivens niveibacter]